MRWPSGQAQVCKTCYSGSIPLRTSRRPVLFSAGLLCFGNTHSGGGASTARNTRSSHVLADEITWEQYILKKCPCRPVERCFSETQCSQVGVFEATWEQCVPNNRPYRPLKGRFCKTQRSQVFSPALSAFPPATFVIVTNKKCQLYHMKPPAATAAREAVP